MTASKTLYAILGRMLRLFRMYRFCALVEKEIRAQSTDRGTRDIIGTKDFLDAWGEDTFYVNKAECIKKFRVWLARDKGYIADRTYRGCIENKYLLINKNDQITLNYKHFGGADLVEGYGYGFLREVLRQEWKFISLVFLVIGFIAGRVS